MSTLPGRLRHRVRIERPFGTRRDASGARSGKDRQRWGLYRQVWAEIEPLTGKEEQKVVPNVTHRVVIRYLEGVEPKMRVVHRRRHLNIEAVLDRQETRRAMELQCIEQVL